jgi:hypothetical protein
MDNIDYECNLICSGLSITATSHNFDKWERLVDQSYLNALKCTAADNSILVPFTPRILFDQLRAVMEGESSYVSLELLEHAIAQPLILIVTVKSTIKDLEDFVISIQLPFVEANETKRHQLQIARLEAENRELGFSLDTADTQIRKHEERIQQLEKTMKLVVEMLTKKKEPATPKEATPKETVPKPSTVTTPKTNTATAAPKATPTTTQTSTTPKTNPLATPATLPTTTN